MELSAGLSGLAEVFDGLAVSGLEVADLVGLEIAFIVDQGFNG